MDAVVGTRRVAGHASEMVCDCAPSECSTELGEDASLKRALEELLKCMLRVWCREGQALTRLGDVAHGKFHFSDRTGSIIRVSTFPFSTFLVFFYFLFF